MGNLVRKCCYLTAVALLCFASSALAETVPMTLQGTVYNNTALGGVYISPYPFQINGTDKVAICDDFTDDIVVGETWSADVITPGASGWLSSTMWKNATDYEEAAYLAAQLLNQTTSCTLTSQSCAGDYSYAIWAIFDPGALGNLSGNDLTNASALIAAAKTAVNDSTNPIGYLSGFQILTPISSGTCGFPPVACGSNSPQEFMVDPPVVPEPPTSVLLGGGVLGLIALFVAFRRGKVRTA